MLVKMSENCITSEHWEKNEQNYNAEIQKLLDEVNLHQESLHKINVLSSEEIFEVEEMYNRLRKPKYEKRQEIISRIPDFWVNVFLNHPHIKSILCAEEEDCLYYLSKIEVEESENIKSGYNIKFFFKENPYFDNEILIKERNLEFCEKESALRTIINWKDHYFAERIRRKNEIRYKCMEAKTFFGWLTDNYNPVRDYTAEVIKYEIWKMPLLYFSTDYLVDDNEVSSRHGDNGDMDIEEQEEEEFEDEYMDTEEEEEESEDGITEEEEEVEEYEERITGTEEEEEVEEYEERIMGTEEEEEVEEYEERIIGTEEEEEVIECVDSVAVIEEEKDIEECEDDDITEVEEVLVEEETKIEDESSENACDGDSAEN